MIRVASEEYLKTDRTALFLELTELLKPRQCFEKQPSFYMKRLAWYVFVHAAMLVLIGLSSNLWACLLFLTVDAVFILRLGFIGHDLAHGAVSTGKFYKEYLGEFVWCFFLGLAKEFWDKKHNLHHKFTNIAAELNGDPDIETPPFVLGEQQAKTHTNLLARSIVRFQHIVYWFTLTLLVIGLTFESFLFLLKEEFKGRPLQVHSRKGVVVSLILAGYLVNNFPLFLAKPLWMGLLLLLYKYLIAGFCIGFVFALNHVGLPTLAGDCEVDRLTLQTYTSRNISGPFGRWFWGVLAYQTEHHLWPGISWHKLPEVAAITKAFCERHGIIYNEERPVRSFLDSVATLKRLGEQSASTH
jgi:fatty acid desaturase